MMKRVIVAGLACAALLVARPCSAGLQLSVVEDPGSTADLGALQAGQTVTFDVVLSGLDVAGGQSLGLLGGTVVFDGALLGQPLTETPGTIVPDSTNFLTAPAPGQADVSYLDLSATEPITSIGTLFSFSVQVQTGVTGSGVLSLDPSYGGYEDAFDASLSDQFTITPGADLPFVVISPTTNANAVPEPETLILAGIALVTTLARTGFTRSRAGRRASAT